MWCNYQVEGNTILITLHFQKVFKNMTSKRKKTTTVSKLIFTLKYQFHNLSDGALTS